jgi:isopentenyl diphosphate isomerase/L-lactate dehydrogenase-like FMN-dependent dehydrogenase
MCVLDAAATIHSPVQILPKVVFDYYSGGAFEQVTLGRNERAWDHLVFLPKYLSGTKRRDQSIELFGLKLDSPVVLAPTGFADLACPDGQIKASDASMTSNNVHYVHRTFARKNFMPFLCVLSRACQQVGFLLT